jgi:CrcB protein
MTRFLLVCAGGAFGSGVRYLIGVATPHGTLIVNLVGSFVIAVAMEAMAPSALRLMIVTGILGGFTTYSAFNEQTLRMLREGSGGAAALNVAVTVAGCLAAGYVGFATARLLAGSR